MGSDQRFSLKWNNYQSHLVTAFESLLGESDFVDVTLGVEGRRLSAHKMLLSACSPYFRELLKGNPCQHPIIVLRDIRYDDLHSLLHFMYNGEVNVAQDQLNSFLKSAESLKIRGLTDSTEDVNAKDPPPTPVSHPLLKKKRPLADSGSSATPSPMPKRTVPNHQPPPPSVPPRDPEPVKQEVIDINDDQYDEPAVGYEGGGGGGGGVNEGALEQYDEGGYDEGALAVPDGGDADAHSDSQGDLLYNEEINPTVADRSTTMRRLSELSRFDPLQIFYAEDGSAIDESESGRYEDHFSAYSDTAGPVQDAAVCNICGKGFRTKGGLSHHKEVHKGLTDCPLCGRVQSKVANLKRHLATVHKVDMSLSPLV